MNVCVVTVKVLNSYEFRIRTVKIAALFRSMHGYGIEQ